MTKNRVLFILTGHSELGRTGKKTGYYLSEVSHPFFELKKAGYEIDFATIGGGRAPMDPDSFDLSDDLNKKFVSLSLLTSLEQTKKISALNSNDYKLVFFPGGHGTVYDLPNNKDVEKIVVDVYEKGGIIGAVCHGPAGIMNVKLSDGNYLVSGKKVNSFTDEEEVIIGLDDVVPFLLETELRKRGAIFEKALPEKAIVIESHRLITGQNPASAKGVGAAMARALKELG